MIMFTRFCHLIYSTATELSFQKWVSALSLFEYAEKTVSGEEVFI